MTETKYASLREKMTAEKSEREARYARFEELFTEANMVGLQAGYDTVPTPMLVTGYAPVMDGLCGFAWVAIRPRTSSFSRWLVKTGRGRSSDYHGEILVWIHAHEQSYARKCAHADAMADFLRAQPELSGVTIYSTGRLD